MESSLPQVTYLFGAGASASALPTVKGLPSRIEYVKHYVDDKYLFDDGEVHSVVDFTFNKNEAKNYLFKGFSDLHKYSSDHSTIDTYAKKLDLIHDSSKINELCFFLSLYFNFEQKISGIDPRYDTFLISILTSSANSFPSNLKFLSWNYDLQMELAHARLINSNELNFQLFNNTRSRLNKDEFCSVKINGSCSVVDDFKSLYPIIPNIQSKECKNEDLDFVLPYAFAQIKNNRKFFKVRSNLNFAWYRDSELLSQVTEAYNKTEILVVIGYSFPFFNREVDRLIIRSMRNLKKIYIQDVFPDNIQSRFLSILPDWKHRGIEIIPVTDITEFFLPPEL